METPEKVIAFDIDSLSLASLHRAFPNWEVESIAGATTRTLVRDWNPSAAALLIVGCRDHVESALGLCRGLRSQVGRSDTPLIMLVEPDREDHVTASLAAGADGCLVTPVHSDNLVRALARVRDGNHPGRHTLGLDRAQRDDDWRDEGGES